MYSKKKPLKYHVKYISFFRLLLPIMLFTLMQHFSLYRKSLHEEDIERRKISKLLRREHQKVKRRMGIGKQIEKVSVIKLMIPLQV